MARKPTGSELVNETATASPRAGFLGVLPVDEVPDYGQGAYVARLHIAVECPDCTNIGSIEGDGAEYRNVTKMVHPWFTCSSCSWGPSEANSPERWKAYYAGRLGGTLLFAVNEEHMELLVEYLETNPRRRVRVEFPWEYRSLMNRLPTQITSGRLRNDAVSLVKRLQRMRPKR